MGFFKEEIAIDLGTANTLIIHKNQVVINSPSVVAINIKSNKLVAIGAQAVQWEGRTHDEIKVIRPLQDGVIADFLASEQLIKSLVNQIPALQKRIFPPSLRIVICVPSGITPVERKAVIESAERVNGKEVFLIDEPMAAAIGLGIDISMPKGILIVDIGGGTTEIAVISLFGIVCGSSIRVAGNTFTRDIIQYVGDVYGTSIGEYTAEKIKVQVGSVLQDLKNPPKPIKVYGKLLASGEPVEIEISHVDIAKAIESSISRMEKAVIRVLAQTPPELTGDILENGIYLAGGGSLIRGLVKRLSKTTKMKVTLSDDPLGAVVKGTGIALKEFDYYRPILEDH
ncbi:MAG: rod shape-determining protein [Flavobacteriaceae bacterium]|nr:rod shape-determining protein [Flavobacteriaceae bacterium]MCY4216105.1 rod shape-determining protein [Flavobacteriaceae bacterium]MCY4253575.1 rod shape-determining protein [Flavobacteriaceae bacterium]